MPKTFVGLVYLLSVSLACCNLYGDESSSIIKKGTQKQYTWLEGKAGFVADGDSLVLILKDKSELRVRLKGIDAPERGQEFSDESRKAFLGKILRQRLRLRVEGKDDYGRVLGTLFIEKRNINQEMVQEGWAWSYVFKGKRLAYGEEEDKARSQGKGLWAGENPQNPRDYRRSQKE